jgi:hypothetical protein
MLGRSISSMLTTLEFAKLSIFTIARDSVRVYNENTFILKMFSQCGFNCFNFYYLI